MAARSSSSSILQNCGHVLCHHKAFSSFISNGYVEYGYNRTYNRACGNIISPSGPIEVFRCCSNRTSRIVGHKRPPNKSCRTFILSLSIFTLTYIRILLFCVFILGRSCFFILSPSFFLSGSYVWLLHREELRKFPLILHLPLLKAIIQMDFYIM